MYQIGDGLYEVWLKEDSDGFRWSIALQRYQSQEVTNRGWYAVGPTFPSRGKGAAYIGWKSAQVYDPTPQNTQNLHDPVDEYNALFTSEVAVR